MLSITNIASYLCDRYRGAFGIEIDEMKLHKLLYLTQRECLVRYNIPIFADVFQAWKYGPVAPEVRHYFKDRLLSEPIEMELLLPYMDAINHVFEHYASQNSWSLSSITHGDFAWQSAFARAQCPGGSSVISADDMRADASRIRIRRFLRK